MRRYRYRDVRFASNGEIDKLADYAKNILSSNYQMSGFRTVASALSDSLKNLIVKLEKGDLSGARFSIESAQKKLMVILSQGSSIDGRLDLLMKDIKKVERDL